MVIEPIFFKTQSEFVSKIENWGFVVNKHNKVVKNIDEIENQHKSIEQLRSKLDYDIDGIVYKVNQINLQKD